MKIELNYAGIQKFLEQDEGLKSYLKDTGDKIISSSPALSNPPTPTKMRKEITLAGNEGFYKNKMPYRNIYQIHATFSDDTAFRHIDGEPVFRYVRNEMRRALTRFKIGGIVKKAGK